MERAQQELMGVLLDALYARGLLSRDTYLGAMDLVRSGMDVPAFFRYPVCPAKEAEQGGYP